jgi:hypothetical protein
LLNKYNDYNLKSITSNTSNYAKSILDKNKSSILNNNSGYIARENKFNAENQFNKSSKPGGSRTNNAIGLINNNFINKPVNIPKPINDIYTSDRIFGNPIQKNDKIVKINTLNDTQYSNFSSKINTNVNDYPNHNDDNKEFFDKKEFSEILNSNKLSSYNNLGGNNNKNTSNNSNYTNYPYDKYINKDSEKEKDNYSKSAYSLGDNYQKQTSIIDEKSKGFVGLSNLGNTCYMNTSLQMLMNCDKFIKKIIQTRINDKSGITKEFKQLVLEYQELAKKSSLYKQISPSSFKRAFENTHRSFAGYNQQDSQEFMRKLLDGISSETNTVINKAKFIEIDDKGKSKSELQNEYNKFYSSREKSIVTDFFNGEILNTFVCDNCGKESYSFQKIIDIPIYLSKKTFFFKLFLFSKN